jgi:hypothetical protein
LLGSWPLRGDDLDAPSCSSSSARRGAFSRANGEGQVATAWRDVIDGAPLVLYDLRVANGCEQESPDDFPPG